MKQNSEQKVEDLDVSPTCGKLLVIRSACRKTWITKDGRIAFLYGKVYTHGKSEELSINGDFGIVMWMSSEKYHEHFEKCE